jgi:hypothetical protein
MGNYSMYPAFFKGEKQILWYNGNDSFSDSGMLKKLLKHLFYMGNTQTSLLFDDHEMGDVFMKMIKKKDKDIN